MLADGALLTGIEALFSSPAAILTTIGGAFLGILVGSIPGLNGTMALALILPFSYYLDPLIALIILYTVSKASDFGGSIPAILLNTPGTPSAAATQIEGHALSAKGYPVKALRTATAASASGDIVSELILIFGAAALATYAVRIGPPDLLAIYIVAFVIISSVVGESILKGLLSTALGFVLSLVGFDPMSGDQRLTFGQLELMDGLPLVPALIGVLVISEVLQRYDAARRGAPSSVFTDPASRTDDRLTLREYTGLLPTIGRSTLIGTSVGMLPGIGASVASFLSFAEARRKSKPGDKWGEGELKGIAASEAANNSTSGANLVPLLTLGIPGSTQAALLAGAMLIHGISIGPQVFVESGELIYALFTAGLLCIASYFVIGFWFSPMLGRVVLRASPNVIYPVILVVSLASAYMLRQSIFDVYVMMGFGIIGYYFRRFGYNLPAFIIALLLGTGAERVMRQTMLISDDGLLVMFMRPISLSLLCLAVLMVALRVIAMRRRRGASA